MTLSDMGELRDGSEAEPFFITENVAAEMIAAGYEFKPPGHVRTKSVRDLFGWQPGETLDEAIARHQGKPCSAS
ncbi:transcriptional regulator [Xanthomonas oryzae pv. oryzicola]|uniref:transcriptional regulator n=1 Tax=Xanthomonas oryzae TaxID=347 RepID=UPI003D17C23C